MTSGPVVVSVLEGENAVRAHRDLLGPTNSNEAPAGTIRGDFGTDIERNAAHGSDATATARIEISYFFGAAEILAPVDALWTPATLFVIRVTAGAFGLKPAPNRAKRSNGAGSRKPWSEPFAITTSG